MIKVFTWNTQGNFEKKEKGARIRSLLQKYPIGCIQEGGKKEDKALGFKIRKQKVHYRWGLGPGAKNKRCTNWLLSDKKGEEREFKTIGGGVAGRKPAAMILNKILYVSWHSTASGNNEDTSFLFREILRDVLWEGKASLALVGGDFNTDQKELNDVAYRATYRWDFSYTVFDSGKVTHQSGKTLDYFVLFYEGKPRIYTHKIRVERVPESDHDPVILELEQENFQLKSTTSKVSRISRYPARKRKRKPDDDPKQTKKHKVDKGHMLK